MKKYVFESLKFFCAAILCTILSAFATSSYADNSCRNLFDINDLNMGSNPDDNVKYKSYAVPNGTYTMSTPDFPTGSSTANMFFLAGNVSSGASSASNGVFQGTSRTINVSDGYYTIGYRTGITNPNNPKDYSWQIELGSTATAYTPYNPSCGCDGTVVNYVSATGTGTQSGTPTPTNPIEPVFYQQGNMVLRKVGDYADTYDATTGKITRRVGVKVLDGTESWTIPSNATKQRSISKAYLGMVPSGVSSVFITHYPIGSADIDDSIYVGGSYVNFIVGSQYTMEQWKQYLAQQYANGTPVTIYYPLAEETTEDWPASYCETPIKIATTKYNESAFSPLNTALANAISVVDTVVSNTITQAASIATLQTQKQTRPADDTCPAYKQCLLVEDENGKPHWYEITDPFRDFVAPIIANNVAPASTTNSAGYTQLEYIESTGTQYIDTGVRVELGKVEIKYTMLPNDGDWATIIGKHGDNIIFRRKTATSDYEIYMYSSLPYTWLGGYVENQTRTLQVSRSGNNIIIYSNGQLVFEGQNDKKEGGEDNSSIYLFSSTLSGKSVYPSKSRLYYAKFYTKDGTLVRNFVPVRNNATGKYGMYDTVSRQFYGNAATSGDDFTSGPEVLNQDPDVPGMTWTATWAANATTGVSAGTITGEALCNNLSKTENALATDEDLSNTNFTTSGNSCWCKAVSIDNVTGLQETKWSYHKTDSSCASGCVTWCPYAVLHCKACRESILNY